MALNMFGDLGVVGRDESFSAFSEGPSSISRGDLSGWSSDVGSPVSCSVINLPVCHNTLLTMTDNIMLRVGSELPTRALIDFNFFLRMAVISF